MKIKIKKLHPDAVTPVKANPTDSGYDLFAIDDGVVSEDGSYIEYKTGLSVEPPKGYDIQLRPRSSISKYDLILANSVGTVDNGYRGPVNFRFKFMPIRKDTGNTFTENLYKKGDKIGQMILSKVYDTEIEEVQELSNTERGEKGFGSSGQ